MTRVRISNTSLVSGLLILVAAACQNAPSGQVNTEWAPGMEDSIRDMFRNYYDDVRRHGLTAEFKYLDSSADFSWIPPGYKKPISYDSVSRILRRSAPLLRLVDNHVDSLTIIILGSGEASYYARLYSKVIDTSGKTTYSKLRESGLLVRRSSGWKLLSGQTTIVKP